MTDTQQANNRPPVGVVAIGAERARQVGEKGYSPEHDAEHGPAQLISAALAYAMQAQDRITMADGQGHSFNGVSLWPWDLASFKQDDDDELRSLAKAGALIAAAYDAAIARRSGGDQ